ncbi:carboxypeptidase regulatory-like domain-containing protein [Fulvivirga ulvae]|uniref:carboxypeptidase regulatory-like domain-containing protein n=1 Tax=Fulvivirga ulvae TaxID=2904245 RepID=UPI001F3F43CD|nr:carboxypeptidase regulatory-like domain-containing protein [Fulvivirga ulvae]UII32377.1 carboxypeptidase regulatory-like domain-containing protein [Fulvivirga ulvae]
MKYVLLFLMAVSFIACKSSTAQQVLQGIKGQVLWFEGNFMPGPGQSNKGKPVHRTVLIYEVTSMNNVVQENQLYEKVPSKLIKTIETDENGNFSIHLPPGRYSVFTKEENGLFANVFDGEGNINPVTVKPGEMTEITIDINYKAVY